MTDFAALLHHKSNLPDGVTDYLLRGTPMPNAQSASSKSWPLPARSQTHLENWNKADSAAKELLAAEAAERQALEKAETTKAQKEHAVREAQKQKSDRERLRRDASKAKQAEVAQQQKQAMIAADRRAQQAKKAREEDEWRQVFEKCKADKEKAETQRMLVQFNEEHAALTREIKVAADGNKPFDYKRMLDWIAKVEASGICVGLTQAQWEKHKNAMEQVYAAQRPKGEEARGSNPTQGRGDGKGRGRGRGRGGGRGGARGVAVTVPPPPPAPPAPAGPPAPATATAANDDDDDAEFQAQLQRALQMSEQVESVRRAQEERYAALQSATVVAAPTASAIKATTTTTTTSRPPAAPPQASAESNKDDECVICWNATATHVVVPCGHLCMCPDCVPKELGGCPVCRGPMAHVMKVYRP